MITENDDKTLIENIYVRLKHEDSWHRKNAVERINTLNSEEQKVELFKIALNDESIDVKLMAIELIPISFKKGFSQFFNSLNKEEQIKLIQTAFNQKEFQFQDLRVNLIELLPQLPLDDHIKTEHYKYVQNEVKTDRFHSLTILNCIQYLSDKKIQVECIKTAMQDQNDMLDLLIEKAILLLDEDNIVDFLKRALKNKSEFIKSTVLNNVIYLKNKKNIIPFVPYILDSPAYFLMQTFRFKSEKSSVVNRGSTSIENFDENSHETKFKPLTFHYIEHLIDRQINPTNFLSNKDIFLLFKTIDMYFENIHNRILLLPDNEIQKDDIFKNESIYLTYLKFENDCHIIKAEWYEKNNKNQEILEISDSCISYDKEFSISLLTNKEFIFKVETTTEVDIIENKKNITKKLFSSLLSHQDVIAVFEKNKSNKAVLFALKNTLKKLTTEIHEILIEEKNYVYLNNELFEVLDNLMEFFKNMENADIQLICSLSILISFIENTASFQPLSKQTKNEIDSFFENYKKSILQNQHILFYYYQLLNLINDVIKQYPFAKNYIQKHYEHLVKSLLKELNFENISEEQQHSTLEYFVKPIFQLQSNLQPFLDKNTLDKYILDVILSVEQLMDYNNLSQNICLNINLEELENIKEKITLHLGKWKFTRVENLLEPKKLLSSLYSTYTTTMDHMPFTKIVMCSREKAFVTDNSGDQSSLWLLKNNKKVEAHWNIAEKISTSTFNLINRPDILGFFSDDNSTPSVEITERNFIKEMFSLFCVAPTQRIRRILTIIDKNNDLFSILNLLHEAAYTLNMQLNNEDATLAIKDLMLAITEILKFINQLAETKSQKNNPCTLTFQPSN